MSSTFFGLNIGYKGLQAQQSALNVTSHNIANANTQGYTRQDVIMEASAPVKVLQGYLGSGVDVAEFRRIRDQYLDSQLRTENKALGEWEVKSDILSKLEVVMNEPSEASLRSVMDAYWEAWQDLSTNPESVAVRTTVIESGVTLVDTFNHMDRQFRDLQEDINKGIEIKVDEINSLARQIRDLNVQIVKAEAGGATANDLRDKRDLLVEQMSKIVDIDVAEDQLGALNVTIGGRTVVSREFLTELKFTVNESDPSASTLEWINPLNGVSLGDVRVGSGELKGYLDMRDEIVPQLRDQVSELAKRIAFEVNQAHRNGYALDDTAGLDFFVRTDETKPFSAGNISVNQQLIDNVELLAASAETPAPAGDGGNALIIAQLKNKTLINSGIQEPVASITGSPLTADPLDIAEGSNRITITINGTTKTVDLTPGTYTLVPDTLTPMLAQEINLAFGSPPGPAVISASLTADNELEITASGGAGAGITDISGPAAQLLGIAQEYSTTFDDYYRSLVAKLGISSQEASRMTDNQSLLTQQITNKRESISGVSLDEEMTNMIKYQHAYSAAARVINVMDEMLDLIVNRLGMVGR